MVMGVEQGARRVQVAPKPGKIRLRAVDQEAKRVQVAPRPGKLRLRAADREAWRVQVAPRPRKLRFPRRRLRRRVVDPGVNNVQLHGK